MKGDTGGFFEKNPPDPLKTFHCVCEQKNAVAFFALHKVLSAMHINSEVD